MYRYFSIFLKRITLPFSRRKKPYMGGSYSELNHLIDASSAIVFIPALALTLSAQERQKGAPLLKHEVEKIRDTLPCIIMEKVDIATLNKKRGFVDIDPENAWAQWNSEKTEINLSMSSSEKNSEN
jgi:hypothetical protein